MESENSLCQNLLERGGRTKFRDGGLIELPISAEALFSSSELPMHHKDPFDRVILAQAQLNACRLVSSDSEFPAYGIPLIW